MEIKLNEGERNLIKNSLRDYENKHYSHISKEENDFIFKVIDKFN